MNLKLMKRSSVMRDIQKNPRTQGEAITQRPGLRVSSRSSHRCARRGGSPSPGTPAAPAAGPPAGQGPRSQQWCWRSRLPRGRKSTRRRPLRTETWFCSPRRRFLRKPCGTRPPSLRRSRTPFPGGSRDRASPAPPELAGERCSQAPEPDPRRAACSLFLQGSRWR